MVKDKIYTEKDIQLVWSQFHRNPNSVLWSDDEGITWNEVPSMDTGKWARFSIIEGKCVKWIYKCQ